MAHPPLSITDLLRLSAWPFALAAAAALLCYLAAGQTLGFYLGPVMAITLIMPIMVAPQSRLLEAIVIAGAMVDAVGIAWLLAVPGPHLAFLQWLACYITIAAYAFALMALTRVTAAWVAIIAGVAWLTWPVWTATFLDINLASWLTPAHPLMAINRVVLHLGVWLEQPLMYRYATLGQDVPYTLPRTIWPCVFVHAIIGLLLLAPTWWWERSRARAEEAERPEAPAA